MPNNNRRIDGQNSRPRILIGTLAFAAEQNRISREFPLQGGLGNPLGTHPSGPINLLTGIAWLAILATSPDAAPSWDEWGCLGDWNGEWWPTMRPMQGATQQRFVFKSETTDGRTRTRVQVSRHRLAEHLKAVTQKAFKKRQHCGLRGHILVGNRLVHRSVSPGMSHNYKTTLL